MITLIAAALAAAPATPAQPADAHAQHAQHQQGKPAEQKGMDCCKDGCKGCCKDMAAKRSDHGSGHSDHSAHQQ